MLQRLPVARRRKFHSASLDGYIATPDGGIGWLAPFEISGEDYGYVAFYASVDGLLLGRRTYEQVLTFGEWPYAGKPCWVFACRPPAPARPEVIATAQTPRAVAAELAARGIRRAWLVGGGQLAGAFRAAGLIGEIILSVIPVILGAGIPLFGAPSLTTVETLRLVKHRAFANGVVQFRYQNDAHHIEAPERH